MSELESIENELRSLKPKSVPTHLTDRIENGLGDAGNLAMRRVSEDSQSDAVGPKVAFNWFQFAAFGIAAVFVCSAFGIYLLNLGANENPDTLLLDSEQSSIAFGEDPESPIHGVTVAELEQRSGMPVGGWTPIFQERLLDRVDEGIVSKPSGTPARQVRIHYLDEILWQHPEIESRILSTQPRQEIILIDLDLY